MPPEIQRVMPPTIPPPPPSAWEKAVPAAELLKPTDEALQRDIPTPEDAAKLNLRSAADDEWSSPENSLDLLEETAEHRAERLAREQKEGKENDWDNQHRTEHLESLFGQRMFSYLIQMQNDAAFQKFSKQEKYSKAFESVASNLIDNEFKSLFPEGFGGKLLQVYAQILEELGELPETVEELSRAEDEFMTKLQLLGPPPAPKEKIASPQDAARRRTDALKRANQATQMM